MGVLMTLRVKGDVAKLEQLWNDEPNMIRAIAERGKAAGAIHHRFWKGEGEVFVVDEWPDEKSFHDFFASSPDIADIMKRCDVTTEPQIEFWTKAAVDDAF